MKILAACCEDIHMLRFSRPIKSIIASILLLVIFELTFYRILSFYLLALGSIILFVLLFAWLEKKSFISSESLIKLLLPLILLISLDAFIFFESSPIFIHLVIILSTFCFYLFFSRMKIPLPKEESVIVTYYWLDLISFLTAFLYFLFVQNLLFVKNFPIWFLMILVTLGAYLIFFYVLWARSKEGRIVPVFSSLFALILLETFLMMSFWNIDPVPKSLLMVVLLYFYLGVLDLKLRGELTGKKVIEYLLISIIASLIIILTVRW
ncbi:MAG: hypothetical protein NT039_01280 [Candidatus Berkelbacteria bacterium]|nr:hypothetical protein [Candidatus Berkelbacteria bacterium]